MKADPPARNTDRTRRAILDAAATALCEQGTAAAVGPIAEAAGVSKSGLLHHFPNRDDLLLAVAQDSLEKLRGRVQSLIDLSENRPGKMLRAYIRALFEGSDDVRSHLEYPELWNVLYVVPGVPELLQHDAAQWWRDFAVDGLDADRILLARYAAEGIAASISWDSRLTPDLIERAKKLILSVTDHTDSIGDDDTP